MAATSDSTMGSRGNSSGGVIRSEAKARTIPGPSSASVVQRVFSDGHFAAARASPAANSFCVTTPTAPQSLSMYASSSGFETMKLMGTAMAPRRASAK